MEEAVLNFPKQFNYKPVIENAESLKQSDKFILCGMGGSALGALLLKRYDPKIDLLLHRDYGLPRVPEYFLKESLIILSSYSGNTEEVLDNARAAKAEGLNVIAIANEGQLLAWAKENKIPYIDLPNDNVEPRMAVGYSMLALAKAMGNETLYNDLVAIGPKIDPASLKDEGVRLANSTKDKRAVVYSSNINMPIAYNWKIKFNETAKIPASFNVFPELCHNELSGYDSVPSTHQLISNINAIFITDDEDNPRLKKRMDIMWALLEERGVKVSTTKLVGENILHKIFNSILLAEWTALTLASFYGVEDAKTPLIAEFKTRMASQ